MPRGQKRKFTDDEFRKIHQRYLDGEETKHLASELEVTSKRLNENFRRLVLPTRSEFKDSLPLDMPEVKVGTYQLLKNWFREVETELEAYWLGFMMADGYVKDKHQIRLRLKEADLDLLEMFKAHLNINNKICHEVNKTTYKGEYKEHKCVSLYVFNADLVSNLNRYGVINSKCYK